MTSTVMSIWAFEIRSPCSAARKGFRVPKASECMTTSTPAPRPSASRIFAISARASALFSSSAAFMLKNTGRLPAASISCVMRSTFGCVARRSRCTPKTLRPARAKASEAAPPKPEEAPRTRAQLRGVVMRRILTYGRAGEVAADRLGVQLGILQLHLDRAELVLALSRIRQIPQKVLRAQFRLDLPVDLRQRRGLADEERLGARVRGELGHFRLDTHVEKREVQADEVDRHAGRARIAAQRRVVGPRVVVVAVRQDDDGFPSGQRAELVERHDDGVVERGASGGMRLGDSALEVRGSVGEGREERGPFAELD